MQKQPINRPFGLKLVALVVLIEGLFIASLVLTLGLGIFRGEARSLVTMLALNALVAGAAAWVIYIAWSIFKGKRWARSAAVFWQLIQLAVASASFGGQFGSALIGWSLIVPSVVVLILIFTKPVIAATMSGAEKEI